MKQRIFRPLGVLLLAGWCLLFLRCETTEKSMIRAVFLAQQGDRVTVGLLYQAPDAAADASDASAETAVQAASADTLERAFALAEKELPRTADYRLCDYLLLDRATPETLLAGYEDLVLEKEKGRLAARVCILAAGDDGAEELPDGLSDKLLEQLRQNAGRMPRLYRSESGLLLPQLRAEKNEVTLCEKGVFRRGAYSTELDAEQTEMTRLLLGLGSGTAFWPEGKRVEFRRCSISVTVQGSAAKLRLDCQQAPSAQMPDAAQCKQLEELCIRTVQMFWQQGVDLLHLQQYSALQNGTGREAIAIKNACPQLQADVRFYA